MKKIRLLILISAFMLCSLTAFSQEKGGNSDESEQGVNTGQISLFLNGGIGMGNVVYGGNTEDDTFAKIFFKDLFNFGDDDVYEGKGVSFELGAMPAWKFLAVKTNFSYATATDPENESGEVLKAKVNNWVMDLAPALIYSRDANDMGYSLIYLGWRWWGTSGEPETGDDVKITGNGWLFGWYNFSTIPVAGPVAIVIKYGIFFSGAPVNEVTVGNTTTEYTDYTGFNFGLELGLGVAIENIGLSVTISYKRDYLLSWKEDAGYTKAGSGLWLISGTKQFDFL